MRILALILVAAAAACGPKVRPEGPGGEPSATPEVRAPTGGPPRRNVAIGQLCPERAAGRPAVSVLAARRLSWTVDEGELEPLVARGVLREFTVLSWQGRRAGVFGAIGPVDLGTAAPVATGGYAGAAPCEGAADELECAEVLGGCYLAVAEFSEAEGSDAPDLETGGGCVEDGRLVVDLDGDGQRESFEAAAFVDGMRAPAEELEGAPAASAACEPRFAARGLVTGNDPKLFLGLDLIGVADLDGDGRHELVLQYRYADHRTWAIYVAERSALALELAVEVQPWAR